MTDWNIEELKAKLSEYDKDIVKRIDDGMLVLNEQISKRYAEMKSFKREKTKEIHKLERQRGDLNKRKQLIIYGRIINHPKWDKIDQGTYKKTAKKQDDKPNE